MDKYIKNADLYNLPAGTRFNVSNGAWDGEILEINGIKYLWVYGTNKKYELADTGRSDLDICILNLQDLDIREKAKHWVIIDRNTGDIAGHNMYESEEKAHNVILKSKIADGQELSPFPLSPNLILSAI